MKLNQAIEGRSYRIHQIQTNDDDLNAFLFSLGCYSGEDITVVRQLRGGCVVAIRNGRYTFDRQLAEAISV